jgi:hypothetical protein
MCSRSRSKKGLGRASFGVSRPATFGGRSAIPSAKLRALRGDSRCPGLRRRVRCPPGRQGVSSLNRRARPPHAGRVRGRAGHLARPLLCPGPSHALTDPLRVLYRGCVARDRRGCDHGFPGGAGALVFCYDFTLPRPAPPAPFASPGAPFRHIQAPGLRGSGRSDPLALPRGQLTFHIIPRGRAALRRRSWPDRTGSEWCFSNFALKGFSEVRRARPDNPVNIT